MNDCVSSVSVSCGVFLLRAALVIDLAFEKMTLHVFGALRQSGDVAMSWYEGGSFLYSRESAKCGKISCQSIRLLLRNFSPDQK